MQIKQLRGAYGMAFAMQMTVAVSIGNVGQTVDECDRIQMPNTWPIVWDGCNSPGYLPHQKVAVSAM